MRILTVVASKHGSTRAIAAAIAEELRAAGHEVDLREVTGGETADDDGPAMNGYDAVVAGSAVYMGRWMAEAREFVAEHGEQLAVVPVCLFSSGPLGDDYPEGMGVPEHLDELLEQTGAREHTVFVGRLDKSELNLAERLAARMVKAPEGDFRDWDAIRSWARGIAEELES